MTMDSFVCTFRANTHTHTKRLNARTHVIVMRRRRIHQHLKYYLLNRRTCAASNNKMIKEEKYNNKCAPAPKPM